MSKSVKSKNSRGVFRKVYPQHPCLDSSYNSPILLAILTINDMQDDESGMLLVLIEVFKNGRFLAHFVSIFIYALHAL